MPDPLAGVDSSELLANANDYLRSGDHIRGEQYLVAALKAGASERVVIPRIVAVCVAASRYRSALAYLKPYLARRPSDHRMRHIQAAIHFALGEANEAHRILNDLVRLRPRNASHRYLLAIVVRDGLADSGESRAHFQAFLALEQRGKRSDEVRAWLSADERTRRTADGAPTEETSE